MKQVCDEWLAAYESPLSLTVSVTKRKLSQTISGRPARTSRKSVRECLHDVIKCVSYLEIRGMQSIVVGQSCISRGVPITHLCQIEVLALKYSMSRGTKQASSISKPPQANAFVSFVHDRFPSLKGGNSYCVVIDSLFRRGKDCNLHATLQAFAHPKDIIIRGCFNTLILVQNFERQ